MHDGCMDDCKQLPTVTARATHLSRVESSYYFRANVSLLEFQRDVDITPDWRCGYVGRGYAPDSRLLPCPSGTNPNCVSTSSTNDNYAAPWVAAPVFTTSQVKSAGELPTAFPCTCPSLFTRAEGAC